MKRISFTVAVGLALLVFAAPANATHVACGATLTTDTVLDSDIVCAEGGLGRGVTIGADNVTLWFQGHSITGPGSAEFNVGVYAGHNNVTVRGAGTIQGFDYGVWMQGSDNSVRRTTITSTECGGYGIFIEGERAYAYRNVVDSAPCTGNSATGIFLGGSVGAAGQDSYAWGNTVRGGVGGIVVGGNRARAVLNTVEDCGSYGISVVHYEGTYAVANRNAVSGCLFGIYGDPAGEQDNGNGRFALNTVTGNQGGMAIQDNTAIVGRNTVNDNTQTGIGILYPGTLIRRNTAFGNGFVDIDAPVGANDGGENRGTNCENVSCGP